MQTLNYQNHAEYAFSLSELRALLESAPPDHDAFYIAIGFECQNDGTREFKTKIEGATGLGSDRSGNFILGCPIPPDCPHLKLSLGLTI